MREYLDLKQAKPGSKKKSYLYDVHSLGPEERFPVKRCLCIIGSDWQSYSNVRKLTGGVSDGLVKQDRAYIVSGPRPKVEATEYDDASRASWANVHRAHSGYRGIVNSYESYEKNIQRFLFGDTMQKKRRPAYWLHELEAAAYKRSLLAFLAQVQRD